MTIILCMNLKQILTIDLTPNCTLMTMLCTHISKATRNHVETMTLLDFFANNDMIILAKQQVERRMNESKSIFVEKPSFYTKIPANYNTTMIWYLTATWLFLTLINRKFLN